MTDEIKGVVFYCRDFEFGFSEFILIAKIITVRFIVKITSLGHFSLVNVILPIRVLPSLLTRDMYSSIRES